MGTYCTYDRDVQCLYDCPDCGEYRPDECCICGTTDEPGKLLHYDDKIYCAECLSDELLEDTSGAVYHFISDKYEDFVKFVGGYHA